ncbi:hypothetical protein EU545_02985 [Candidatus Thorarchaeota archaeon]|nr:MAG: hypothetical protein EU545_02985 [Candidatus Thorarchaeota archaeon]
MRDSYPWDMRLPVVLPGRAVSESPTLNGSIRTTRKGLTPPMILLFTSKDCTWCDLLKDMILEETDVFGEDSLVCEIDINRYTRLAQAYGIVTVPTMVARSSILSGIPEADDLRSFLFRAFSERTADSGDVTQIIDHALLLRKTELPAPRLGDDLTVVSTNAEGDPFEERPAHSESPEPKEQPTRNASSQTIQ